MISLNFKYNSTEKQINNNNIINIIDRKTYFLYDLYYSVFMLFITKKNNCCNLTLVFRLPTFFDNLLLLSVIFQATTSNTCCFQLLKCDNLLLFLWRIWVNEESLSCGRLVGQKKAIWKCPFRLQDTAMNPFHSLTFYRQINCENNIPIIQ